MSKPYLLVEIELHDPFTEEQSAEVIIKANNFSTNEELLNAVDIAHQRLGKFFNAEENGEPVNIFNNFEVNINK